VKKFALTVALLGLWAIEAVHAAEFFCSSGDVSCLIAKINRANQNGEENTINLAAGTYTLTSIDNSSGFGNNIRNGLPRITSAMIINGESAETTIIERDPGAPEFRILDVADSGRLTLNGLTIRGGLLSFDAAGISNGGNLTVNQSIIEQNHSDNTTGGIANSGILTISSSIIRNNSGLIFGGGIFNSGAEAEARIMNSSITHNGADFSGGVHNRLGTVIVQNSTISDNSGHSGGGLSNFDNMAIINSTIANNRSGFFSGAGIENGGTLTITNSTISGNAAGFDVPIIIEGNGGGILAGGTVILLNSILALNSARRSGPDCAGSIISLGNNIIGDTSGCDIDLLSSDLVGDPGLGDFVDDGMPGRGHFPLNPVSQAIDAGNSGFCPATDQLGLPRVGECDIGAIEFQGQLLVSIDVRPRSDANKINPNSTNNINVAIFSVNGFDATKVDPNTVRFGATGTEAAPIHVRRRDVDGDGDRDVVARFVIQDTGIKCGDTSAILTGEIPGGPSIIGSSPIQTVQCK
jgi:hypothetical protein